MRPEQQVPRNALAWMIISLFTLVLPHVGRIPPWVLGLYLAAALWRIMVYRGRWSYPSRLLKAGLIVAGTAGIYVSYGTLIGLEPTVGLLLIAFAFKLIELANRKDAYVLLFLAYFICLLEFLFTQHMFMVLYAALNVLLVTTALVALHQPGQHRFNRRSIRHAGVMLAQAVPLMIVLFLLFPRIGPLWSVPLKSAAGKTGMSDFMRPGDVADLSQSSEVAFRVEFEGSIPDVANLYWRGLVFSRLEGDTWSSLEPEQLLPFHLQEGDASAAIDYSIILEPTRQRWLFALGYAESSSPDVTTTSDFTLLYPRPLTEEFRYVVRTDPGATLEPRLNGWRRRVETALPASGNPRTRSLAQQLRQEAGSDREFVRRVMQRFYDQPYIYTLKPPALMGGDRIDRFLFESRQGFCEHYAGAFVYLMRAAGVPARVVAGYMGGEINPVNDTVIVHQFDAHAWAEVWLDGRGWVRMDPTSRVAPERIYMGLEAALRREGSFLADSPLSPLRFRGVEWINRLRLEYDALTYRWQKWVIGFDEASQMALLGRTLGDLSVTRFAAVLLGAFALVMVPVALSLLLRRRVHEPSLEDRYYLEFCDRLARRGARRQAGETPAAFARRAGSEQPELAERIHAITGMYTRLAYAGASFDAQRRAAMRADLKRAVRRFGKREQREVF